MKILDAKFVQDFICSVFVHSHNSFYAKNYATDLTSLRSFTKIVGDEFFVKM